MAGLMQKTYVAVLGTEVVSKPLLLPWQVTSYGRNHRVAKALHELIRDKVGEESVDHDAGYSDEKSGESVTFTDLVRVRHTHCWDLTNCVSISLRTANYTP